MGPRNGALDYRPISVRWPFLVSFLLYVSALIALVEIVGRQLPSSDDIQDGSGNGGVSFPTALLDVPLVNVRAPSPTATPFPSTPKLEERLPSRPPHRLLLRADNATKEGAPAAQESGSVAAWNYHNMPGGDSGPSDNLAGSANITEIQQAEIAKADKTGQPVQFGARLAGPPTSLLNDSRTDGSNQTWNPSRFRPRSQDPSEYAQYSGPTQIIQPLINIFYDHAGVAYEGSSWISYTAGDPNDPDSAAACWATCNGPAIVFHHRYCWEEWVWYAALEQEARQSNPALAWKVVEEAYSGGSICVLPAGENLRAPAGAGADGEDVPAPKAPPTVKVLTLTDSAGTPTATVTRVEAAAGPVPSVMTLRDAAGSPTATITADLSPPTELLLTLADASGAPTATITLPPQTYTLRDERGSPTATVQLARSPGPTVLTLTNASGAPTATVTVDLGAPGFGSTRPQPTTAPEIPGPQPRRQLHLITPWEYALASFLPVLLATPLCILSQMLSSDIRTFLPFHSMTRPGGVPARYSLTMPLEGVAGVVTGAVLAVQYGDPAALMGDLLTLLSAVIASLSSEAVGIRLYGECPADSFRGCFMGIAVFKAPNRALEVLLCVLLVVLVGLAAVLAGWRTGLRSKGVRSLATTAGLLGHRETREVLRDVLGSGSGLRDGEINRRLEGWRFELGCYEGGGGKQEEYGILATRGGGETYGDNKFAPYSSRRRDRCGVNLLRQPTTSWSGLGGLALLSGLLVLILYYETARLPTAFKIFMLAQNFGARVLFTALGVVISQFWDGYFARISMMEVYRRLSCRAQPATTSVLVSPPTTVYTGIGGAFARREWFVMAAGVNTILAGFSPILLSAIPFSPSQTWMAHLVCAWMAVACLALMILTLLYGAVFVRHPRMLMDPGTLAGRIYHVCDSAMLDDFRGVAETGEGLEPGRRYKLGRTASISGERARVDWEEAIERANSPRRERIDEDKNEYMV